VTDTKGQENKEIIIENPFIKTGKKSSKKEENSATLDIFNKVISNPFEAKGESPSKSKENKTIEDKALVSSPSASKRPCIVVSPSAEKRKSEYDLLFNPFASYNPSEHQKESEGSADDENGGEDESEEKSAFEISDMKGKHEFNKLYINHIDKGNGILTIDKKSKPSLIFRSMTGMILAEAIYLPGISKICIKDRKGMKFMMISLVEQKEGKVIPCAVAINLTLEKSNNEITADFTEPCELKKEETKKEAK